MTHTSPRTFGALALSLALHGLLLWRLPLPDIAGGPNPVEQVAIRLAMLAPATNQSAAQNRSAMSQQASATAAPKPAQPEPVEAKPTPVEAQTEPQAPPSKQEPADESYRTEPAPAAKPNTRTTHRESAQSQKTGQQANASATSPNPAETFEREIVIRKPRFRAPPQPPAYPHAARRRGQSGTVLVRARLDTRGDVTEIKVMDSSGYEVLDKAALTAVEDWKFEPYRRGGQALIAWVELPVVFELR